MSVIIPTYNRAHLLEKAIRSIQGQSYDDIEIIVVDDGSQDNTDAVMAGFPEIRYIKQSNTGPSLARQKGLQHAQGEFFASLDSDDFWDKNFVEEAVACIQEHGVDFIFAGYRMENGDTDHFESLRYLDAYKAVKRGAWYIVNAEDTRALFVANSPATNSSMLLKKASVHIGWQKGARVGDDWHLVLDTIMHGGGEIRCAFRTQSLWTKGLYMDNICVGNPDGRKVAEANAHDVSLALEKYKSILSQRESKVIKRNLADIKGALAYYAYKDKSFIDAAKLRAEAALLRM